jgi:murein DD-endopeptidase MepM/ murein hydrolase activator NlpD
MAKQDSKSRTFLKKLRDPYRMVIINEETFEEQLQFRISRLRVILLSSTFFALLCSIIFISIAFSPLKELIPGYDSSELRQKAIQNLFVTDSLIDQYDKNIQYLNAVRAVLSEEITFQDPELSEAALENDLPSNIILTPTVDEDGLLRDFVSQQDKYSPNNTEQVKLKTLLLPPAKGPISQNFDPSKDHYAVDLVLEENSPIKAIADGTVIFSEWTSQTGYVIILEHAYGILSVYKHNASLNKTQGQAVLGGEVIASAGDTGEFSTGFHLHFEMWMDGYPMDPTNFFNFSEK